ncbi:MAG: dTDP-glucose 4,6-dehydratase [Magnetococcales bacterium]|nr:dTDP-glucose 4,6-dehydratase [Magnetococcales bacterium]MBF0151072.1 dTDP-glucose 4,6-dehydratase [Magnetococcales bacterium]MBF0631600.1 dTDP-glucose 4,6-dehydratase [Magnetococcales bacterium]
MSGLLVTGGAGFIGANFVPYWHRHHPEDLVVVLDALRYAGNLANLAPVIRQPWFRFVHGSILDCQLVIDLLRQEKLDKIVHFAAESHVDRSIQTPQVFVETNISGTHSLLMAAREVWLNAASGGPVPHRFHHVSTDEVYGSLGPSEPAVNESAPYRPNSPYAASKAASDHLVRAYHVTYGLQTTISYCSNNYGPMQFPEKLIPLTLGNMLRAKAVPIYGDGSNIRDWLYVEDHCQGIALILERGSAGSTYNISAQEESSNIALVRRLGYLLDECFDQDRRLAVRFPRAARSQGRTSDALITFVSDRPGHDWRYALDASKIRDQLDFRPRIDLDSGLRQTIAWILDHSNEGD